MPINRIFAIISLFLLSACVRPVVVPQAETQMPATAVPEPTASPTYLWSDENAVMSGICFEAALDAAGQVFVLRDAVAHIHFYEAIDNKVLCRHPVTRNSFDFSAGRILAGLWSAGRGCTARHDVLGIQQDAAARTLTILLHFVTEGDCNYELVRPFWIGLNNMADYTVNIGVQ